VAALKPRVLVTHRVHTEVIAYLGRYFEVVANAERQTLPRDQVRTLARNCAGLMAFLPDYVDESFLDGCPNLRVIAAALKGTDNFDVDACTRRNIWLTRVPDLLTAPTAELTVGLLIAITRRFLTGDDHVRSGTFSGWQPLLYGVGLAGKTLGLIGLGAVGRTIAQRLRGFDLRVVYNDPMPASPEVERELSVASIGIEELLATSDFIVPLVHLTPQTYHLINAATIAKMKSGAYIVNVARGSVVDEAAVADALASGKLSGYAADVFEMEDWALDTRPRAVHPALLAERERTFFTPHLASAVDEVRHSIEVEAAENLIDVLVHSRTPRGAVNSLD
jgi:phosphonate dehydrogenase